MASKGKSSRSRKESPGGNELMVLALQEIHNAESQLSRVLPRLAKAVQSDELRERFELRLEQGERLIGEIESALEEMDETPGRKKNIAAEGLINDAREHVQEIEAGPALDSVLLAAMQKTEHYCIAAWGTARSLAKAQGEKSVVHAMKRALKEGKDFDEELTELAKKELTPLLMSSESEDEYDDDQEELGSGRSRSRKNGDNNRRTST